LKSRQCDKKYQTLNVSEQLFFKITFPFSLFSLRCHYKNAPGQQRSGGSPAKPRLAPSTRLAELTTATLQAPSKFVSVGVDTRPNEATVANSTKHLARKTNGKHTSP